MAADSIQNNEDKFTQLFRQYKDRTFDFAVKMLNDREAASDVTQEVFLRLFENLNNHSKISDHKSWLFICARNLCLNRIRDHNKFVPLDNKEEYHAGPEEKPNPQLNLLRRAIATLEDKYREILILKTYMGFTYQEIARIMGITIPSVKASLYEARTRLRATMQKMNVSRIQK